MTTKYTLASTSGGLTRIAGTLIVGRHVTRIYLNLFPGVPFYVDYDDKDRSRFRIFSGLSTLPNTRPYFNQVGSGRRINQLKALEFTFADLGPKYYAYLLDEHFSSQELLYEEA